jgi:hypothetical protein
VSLDARLMGPRMLADWLIYASIILGVALIIQLDSIVPSWLFYSVLAGWIAYLVVGMAVALRKNVAYPASLVLAALTLLVSLPRPEHYMLGLSVASLTFVAGSILQVGVIFSVVRYMLLKRRVLRAVC